MKAIILERKGDLAAVLCEDGTILKTRQSGEVGETIELSAQVLSFPEKRKRRWMRSAVAAALALVITGGSLGYLSTTASAYVSVDVEDASVELAVNHFGRVIAVRAMSDNAEELAEQLRGEVRNKKVEDALDRTMERLHDERSSDDGSAPVIVGVASNNERRNAELSQAAEQSVERVGEHAFYVSEGSRADRDQALSQQQSIGRFFYEHHAPNDWNDDSDDLGDDRDADDRDEIPAVQPGAPAFNPSGSTPAQQPRDEDGEDDDDRPSAPPQQPQNGGVQSSVPFQQSHDGDGEDADDDDQPPAPLQQQNGGEQPPAPPQQPDSSEQPQPDGQTPSNTQGPFGSVGQPPAPPQGSQLFDNRQGQPIGMPPESPANGR